MAELFEDIEINRKPIWPKLSLLLSGSLVLHTALVATVIYVPALREALNIAALLSGSELVSEAYRKTQIEDRATLLALNRFTYPPGYFQIGVKPTAAAPPRVVKETKPKPKPKPTPAPEVAAKPEPPISAEEAEQKMKAAETAADISRFPRINTQPFKDILAAGNEKKTKGEIDLSGNVEITIEADRKEDGSLTNAKIVQKSGDPDLVQFARDLISAVSDSHALSVLKGADRLRVTVKLNANDLVVTVTSDVESPERATQMASGYNLMLSVGAMQKSGQDVAKVFRSTKVIAKGRTIQVNFRMPRALAGAMLQKQLSAT